MFRCPGPPRGRSFLYIVSALFFIVLGSLFENPSLLQGKQHFQDFRRTQKTDLFFGEYQIVPVRAVPCVVRPQADGRRMGSGFFDIHGV